ERVHQPGRLSEFPPRSNRGPLRRTESVVQRRGPPDPAGIRHSNPRAASRVRAESRHPERGASAEFVVGGAQGRECRGDVAAQAGALRRDRRAGVQLHRPVADVHRRRESAVALADAARAAVSAELAGRGRPGSPAATAYSCRGGRPVPRLLSLQQYDSREAPELLALRSEEHTSELQSPCNLVCRLLLEKKKKTIKMYY